MLRAIIVDDEPAARNILEIMLQEHNAEIQVVDSCADVMAAVKSINHLKPDVVFLDIEMPGYSGFQLVELFKEPEFEIIFTTAYAQHAIRAFEVSAVGYLLKPIDEDKLALVVDKLKSKQSMQQRIELLRENLNEPTPKKIALPVAEGLLFVALQNIEYLEADGSYTNLFLEDGSKLLISKKMGEFEHLLTLENRFFRPHRSFIINLNHIKQYIKHDGGHILMNCGGIINLSRDKKDEFQSLVEGIRV